VLNKKANRIKELNQLCNELQMEWRRDIRHDINLICRKNEEIEELEGENNRLADENFELAGNLDILTVENRGLIEKTNSTKQINLELEIVNKRIDLIENILLDEGILPGFTVSEQNITLYNELTKLKEKLKTYEGVDKP
jgi:HAMP domain-containing protein